MTYEGKALPGRTQQRPGPETNAAVARQLGGFGS